MSFSDQIRTALSIDAGGYCANPDCRAATGPFLKGQARAAGDGAHIVAESPNGPRGQSPLTLTERGFASNGVWLCPGCHRKVDVLYPEHYSIETLQQWKDDAPIWWQQNQGKPLQLLARPEVRRQVARPSADSFRGADMFLMEHQPLADALRHLRWRQPASFQHDVPVPEEIERLIVRMSTQKRIGRSWQDEWSTTFHCEDAELLSCMRSLVRSADVLLRPTTGRFDGHRRVNFNQPDDLVRSISAYLSQFDGLQNCLQQFRSYGL